MDAGRRLAGFPLGLALRISDCSFGAAVAASERPRGIGENGRCCWRQALRQPAARPRCCWLIRTRRLLGGQAASALNEILLVFISALVMTFLPALTLLMLLRFFQRSERTLPPDGACPASLCVLFALPAILSGIWPVGAFWLGGFLRVRCQACDVSCRLADYEGIPDKIGNELFQNSTGLTCGIFMNFSELQKFSFKFHHRRVKTGYTSGVGQSE
jgi:hypothetical protein